MRSPFEELPPLERTVLYGLSVVAAIVLLLLAFALASHPGG